MAAPASNISARYARCSFFPLLQAESPPLPGRDSPPAGLELLSSWGYSFAFKHVFAHTLPHVSSTTTRQGNPRHSISLRAIPFAQQAAERRSAHARRELLPDEDDQLRDWQSDSALTRMRRRRVTKELSVAPEANQGNCGGGCGACGGGHRTRSCIEKNALPACRVGWVVSPINKKTFDKQDPKILRSRPARLANH